MAKYKYLPDKNGNVTRCQAHDPSHCPYHLGKDGKPLKHYDTPEEAKKAYEKEQARNHSTTRLSKKTAKKTAAKTKAAPAVDQNFLMGRYRGLSEKELNVKLDDDIAEAQKRFDSFGRHDYYDKIIGLERKMGINHEMDARDVVTRANSQIRAYRADVRSAVKSVREKKKWCGNDPDRCRQMLKERNYNDYGYDPDDMSDKIVCRRAKEVLDDVIRKVNTDIEPIHGIGHFPDEQKRVAYIADQNNSILSNLEGVSGVKTNTYVGDLTDDKNSGYEAFRDNEEKKDNYIRERNHPELAAELYRVKKAMRRDIDEQDDRSRRLDDLKYTKVALPYLKDMKPVEAKNERSVRDHIATVGKNHNILNRSGEYNRIMSMGEVVGASDDGKHYLIRENPNSQYRDSEGMPYTELYELSEENGLSFIARY